jgi:hypothetical protein
MTLIKSDVGSGPDAKWPIFSRIVAIPRHEEQLVIRRHDNAVGLCHSVRRQKWLQAIVIRESAEDLTSLSVGNEGFAG